MVQRRPPWRLPPHRCPPAALRPPQSVAIDSKGDAIVAWETLASGGFYTIDAAYRPAGGAWQKPIPVDDDAVKNVAPSVAFTPGGDATIVWATENGSDEAVASATTTTGTSWSSPIQVATDTTFLAVQVALDSSGEATAAYSGFDGTDYQLGAAEHPPGGDWHSDGNLPPGADEADPLAFDLAVNAATTPRSFKVLASTTQRRYAGRWSAPPAEHGALLTRSRRLPSPTFMEEPAIVVGVDGTVTADWAIHDDSRSGAVWAVRESPAGTWNTPVAISQPIQNDGGGVTVIDPSGDVDILANLFSGSGFPVWSIVDDAGGPALDGLAVPARGTVGVPIDFAVTPIDAWSAISSTHWSFGDGSAATDESVSHVYAKAGTYTIGTSSSDIIGNTTTQDLEDRDRCCPRDRNRAQAPDQADHHHPAHAQGHSGAPPLEGGDAHRRVA